mgnify:CR=1 FL=1
MSGSKIKAKETVAPKTLKRWITASEQNLKMIENAMKHANNPEKLLAIK